MTQADIEKAYTEAVDQLARAVEANRLLTERLQAYEIRDAAVRAEFTDDAISQMAYGLYSDYAEKQPYYTAYNKAVDFALEMAQLRVEETLDRPVGASQDEQPPARPGEPT